MLNMKSSGSYNSSLKKRSVYFYIAFFMIAIISMGIVAWKLQMFD